MSKGKLFWVALLLVVALVSATVVRGYASSLDHNVGVFQTLDEKKANATGLLAASASSATAISLIAGERGAPIAEKLMDLSTCFLIILAVLYLEKYLLLILGTVLFGLGIPVTCGIGVVTIFKPGWKWLLEKVMKVTLCLLIVYCMIPLGVWMSDSIDATYQATIDGLVNDASATEDVVADEEESEQSFWDRVKGTFSGIVDGAKNALSWAKETLSRFVEAIAVMLVTTCIIPLLPLAAGYYLVKWLFKKDMKEFTWVQHLNGRKKAPAELPEDEEGRV